MASTTANYGFTKPDKGATGWDVDINKNLDDIDTQIKARADAIDNIEIGGRNLLQNSDFSNGTNHWSINSNSVLSIVTDSQFGDVMKVVPSTGTNSGVHQAINLSSGEYTISAFIKADANRIVRIRLGNSPEILMANVTTEWQKFSLTATYATLKNASFYSPSDDVTPFYIAHPKCETGNKSTDWTPAPEDVQTQIGDLAVLSTTAKDSIVSALNEVFNEVNDGKTSIYGAIVDKGVTPSSQAFADLVTAIGAITTGGDVTIEGTATAPDILEGKTATVPSGVITGTMSNNGSVTITPGTTDQAIEAGYHDGTGKVVGDSALITDNIKSGSSIFGVTGKTSVVDTADATATTTDIAAGKTAYVNGAKLTGASTADPNVGTHLLTLTKTAYLYNAQFQGTITGIPFLPIAVSWNTNNFTANGSANNSFNGFVAVSRTYHWNCDGLMECYIASSTTPKTYIISPHEHDGTEYPFSATKQTDGTYNLKFDFNDDNHFTNITSSAVSINFTIIG